MYNGKQEELEKGRVEKGEKDDGEGKKSETEEQ